MPPIAEKRPPALIIAALLIPLLIAIATRVHVASSIRTCLNGDESAAGIMAYHIQDRGEHPIFLYGQTHGGGHTVTAHIGALVNHIAAFRDTLHLRTSPILFFALFTLSASLIALYAGGPACALIAGLMIVLSPVFFRVSITLSGYIETLALSALAAFLTLNFKHSEFTSTPALIRRTALIGFLCGLACWWDEFSLPVSAVIFFTLIIDHRKKILPAIVSFGIAFTAGVLPLAAYNIKHNFANFSHTVDSGGVAGQLAHKTTLASFFTVELPSYFQVRNFDDFFREAISPYAYILAAAMLIAIVAAAAIAYADRKTPLKSSPLRRTIIFSLASIALYIAVYVISPFRGLAARYFLPIEPFLTILAAIAIHQMLARRHLIATLVAIALCAAIGYASYQGIRDTATDDTVGDGRQYVSCGAIDNMMEMLFQEKVTHLYSNRFLRWMIVYNSQEKIAAADADLVPQAVAWTEYESAVAAWPTPSFLYANIDPRLPWLTAYLRTLRIPFKTASTASYTLVTPLAPVTRDGFMDFALSGGRKIHR